MTAVETLAVRPGHERRVPAEPMPLARLTDEELVLLGSEHPAVVLPHYEELSEAAQAVAVRTAHRSLLAHGAEPGADGRSVLVPQEVSDLLDVRHGAEWVLVVRRCHNVERDGATVSEVTTTYAHAVDDFALLEQVGDDGVHEFHGLERRGLAGALQHRLTASGVCEGRGDPVRLDLEAVAHGHGDVGLDRLGPIVVQIDATVWRRGPQAAPVLLGVMLGAEGSWATRAAFGERGPVVLEPIGVGDVGGLVAGLLTTVVRSHRP
ncbi:hypothetical protein [Luteipulveratus flavus]|uniref:Uncharacterized protein n=1 Tax=Luteipulveratus flavus TaxID=3031728 RepID=A0ABT6C324_9MICO|nr:hypothetical protein [Luteipulveratus sp. YIM 133296]MDF8263257.1 hypothetical protein [Luteipulveratus sp. YIM 133296]